jgi:2-polyprenyl-3-methyl-5-hydroxy-6-metoxy-1,4-benzoquinol methylase
MGLFGDGMAPFLRRARNSFEYRTGLKLPRSPVPEWNGESFPETAEDLKRSQLFQSWWYYTVELLPEVIAQGIYPDHLPMTPRVMLRNCELEGLSCLDIGSMEGLVPVLMRRMGAGRVLAVDAVDHCAMKMAAVRHYYNVDFDFRTCGLMYALDDALESEGFDFINLSGLLYHVFSPLMVLCGVRPLLKRNGLILVSTGIILDQGYAMEFNNAGRIQEDANTFWYISVELLDYLLRYLRLAPIDCVHMRHSDLRAHVRLKFDKPSGYVSVICRAMDDVLPAASDKWMKVSANSSWEHAGLVDWNTAAQQPVSRIEYRGNLGKHFFRTDTSSMNLWDAVQGMPALTTANSHTDSHTLRLTDRF